MVSYLRLRFQWIMESYFLMSRERCIRLRDIKIWSMWFYKIQITWKQVNTIKICCTTRKYFSLYLPNKISLTLVVNPNNICHRHSSCGIYESNEPTIYNKNIMIKYVGFFRDKGRKIKVERQNMAKRLGRGKYPMLVLRFGRKKVSPLGCVCMCVREREVPLMHVSVPRLTWIFKVAYINSWYCSQVRRPNREDLDPRVERLSTETLHKVNTWVGLGSCGISEAEFAWQK
jgi:hypothetical protein